MKLKRENEDYFFTWFAVDVVTFSTLNFYSEKTAEKNGEIIKIEAFVTQISFLFFYFVPLMLLCSYQSNNAADPDGKSETTA